MSQSKAGFFSVQDLEAQRAQSGKLYREFLRVAAMSAGLYVLPAGATDPQRPHHEDEIYLRAARKGTFQSWE